LIFQFVQCGVTFIYLFIYLFIYNILISFLIEDSANANGGRWLFTCGNQENKLDDLWQETLLGMIGDCFSQDSYVN